MTIPNVQEFTIINFLSFLVQYWNFNFQTNEDVDILKVISKAKFQKQLNGWTRFCHKEPNFVYFSIVD